MIDPRIWEDPSFNRLSVQARLLFVGIISNADDEGYIRGDVGSLKRLIFGFDTFDPPEIQGWLEEVKNLKNVHFYEVSGEIYAHMLNWDKYQKQQKDRIQASAYPKCSICYASATQVPTEVKLSKVKLSQDNTNAPPTGDIEELLNEKGEIQYDWQYQGLEVFEKTGAPDKKKSECMRLAKTYPNLINPALSFCLDYPNPALKWKMFLWRLNQLKKNAQKN